jgi:hypothetical protein
MKILLAAILLLCSTPAFAQTKKFRWGTEQCLFESAYDAKKYTKAQLENTAKLFHLDFFPNTIHPSPFKYADVEKLNVATLDKEYETRVNALKRLNIVKIKYWETLRQKQLKELGQVYQLSRTTILGYANPARLKDVTFAGTCVRKYVPALSKGGDDLLAVWRELEGQLLKNSGFPEIAKKEFEEQFNSPEKFQYAQVEVMGFGWWNCANALINREDKPAENEREFKKLFRQTRTVECDEP